MPDKTPQLATTVEALIEQGNRFEDEGRLPEALAAFQKALAITQNDGEAFWLLTVIGDVLFQQEQFAEGRASLMRAVVHFEEGRGNPFVRMRLGQCMYELGELEEAANWMVGAYLMEGEEFFEEEDPKYLEFMEARLKAAAAEEPQTLASLIAKGKMLEDEGMLSQALDTFQAALSMAEESRDPGAIFQLLGRIGDVYIEQKRYAEGHASFMGMVERFNEGRSNPYVCLRIGQCLYEMGKPEAGRPWLEEAYLSEGLKLFQGDDRKYAELVKAKLNPPPGGWKEGW